MKRIILLLAALLLGVPAHAQLSIWTNPPNNAVGPFITAGPNLTTGADQGIMFYNLGSFGAVNYELGRIIFTGNVFYFHTDQGGTGVARDVAIRTNGASSVLLQTNATSRWQVNSSGHLLGVADNTYDIGASGATRPRSMYAGTSVVAPVGSFTATFANQLQGTSTKTLTETSATGFVTITVASSEAACGNVEYTVVARDATNTQAKSGILHFCAVANSSGTVTAAAVSDVNTLNPVSAGTLTNTMTSTTAVNSTTLLANATSSLTQTLLEIRFRVVITSGTATVTPL